MIKNAQPLTTLCVKCITVSKLSFGIINLINCYVKYIKWHQVKYRVSQKKNQNFNKNEGANKR